MACMWTLRLTAAFLLLLLLLLSHKRFYIFDRFWPIPLCGVLLPYDWMMISCSLELVKLVEIGFDSWQSCAFQYFCIGTAASLNWCCCVVLWMYDASWCRSTAQQAVNICIPVIEIAEFSTWGMLLWISNLLWGASDLFVGCTATVLWLSWMWSVLARPDWFKDRVRRRAVTASCINLRFPSSGKSRMGICGAVRCPATEYGDWFGTQTRSIFSRKRE